MRSIVTDVCKELLGMFVADARLTMATLLLVAIVAGLVVAVQEGFSPAVFSLSAVSQFSSRRRIAKQRSSLANERHIEPPKPEQGPLKSRSSSG
jgi:hypothetical protein